MRLGGNASYYCEITSADDLKKAIDFAKENNIPYKVIGEGSNIIWKDTGFDGLVIKNSLKGFEVLNDTDEFTDIKVASGEMLDDFIQKMTEKNLSGIECLSLIPGTVGATPVQNVGAYGQEISDTLLEVYAVDTSTGNEVVITNKDCSFSYRSSIFKTTARDRYIITAVSLRLSKSQLKPPFYQSLQDYLANNRISDYSPKNIRSAVIDIRSSKLPDWHKVANSGSFFANPIISKDKYNQLRATHPDMPGWQYGSEIKVPAAWLIEKSGFKDFHDHETGIGTWKSQALVLVNENAKSTESLLKVKAEIVSKVQELFDIKLEQEPELLP